MLPAPDAKWLEFLKAGLPSFLGLAAFGAATLYLDRLGYLPMPLPPALALAVAVVGLLSFCLAGGLLLDAAYRAIVWLVRPQYEKHLHKRRDEKLKREFISYIPHLNEHDKKIYVHLLHHNMRVFENTPDCGYASTLFSLGYVQLLGAKGGDREVEYFSYPFGVPDPVWEALVEHRDKFPYLLANAPRSKTVDLAPWRKPRMP